MTAVQGRGVGLLGPALVAGTSERYRVFAETEARFASPHYERLCAGVAADQEVLAFLETVPPHCRQPQRVLAVVRYAFGLQDTYEDFRTVVLDRRDELAGLLLERSTQTNEATRCAATLPILAALPQPLALLELGASAGLCLYPDRYGYRYGEHLVAGGPPVIDCRLVGATAPPLPARLPEIVWRRGIDLSPLDARDPDDVRWLESLVWPGQTAREHTLRDALRVVQAEPPVVVKGDLTEALESAAAEAPADARLVVLTTAVLEYLPVEQRIDVARRIGSLGAAWIAAEAPGTLPCPPWQGAPLGRRHFLLTVGGALAADGPVARISPHGDWLEWGARTPIRFTPPS